MSHATAEPAPSIIALLTTFNRKALTLRCLAALEVAAREAGVGVTAILVDDASTDGTALAVRQRYSSWVEVVEGSGNLYWNRGMHQAFSRALERRAGHYLWLNDDTELMPDALQRLLGQAGQLHHDSGRACIVVGATADRADGAITYGGRVKRSSLECLSFELVWDAEHAQRCDAFEGNCVLIPRQVAEVVGNLDPAFEHAMGDTDYALRALAAGFESYVCPGVVGYCSRNESAGTFFDTSLPLKQRWRLINSRKGLPPRSWFRLTRRHGGLLWAVYFVKPYIGLVLSSMWPLRPRGRAS